MLTIILTIILFCIIAAIFALYVETVNGGASEAEQLNRLAKLVVNANLFNCIEQDKFVYNTHIYTPIISSGSNLYNGAGCVWFDGKNITCKPNDKDYKYIFPEICAYVNNDGDVVIFEPHVYYYENISPDVIKKYAELIKTTINIYKPLLNRTAFRDSNIIERVVIETGFSLNCNVLTTTDAEFITTMENEHPMLYVIFLLSKNLVDESYEYIIDIFNKTLTSENNISADVHFLILQYLYEDVATRNFYISHRPVPINMNKYVLFCYATLFTIIAKSIADKSNQNYKTSIDDYSNIMHETRDRFNKFNSPKPRYRPLYWDYVVQSVMLKFIGMQNDTPNTWVITPTLKVTMYDKILGYLITVTAENEDEENRPYIINKLNAEFCNSIPFMEIWDSMRNWIGLKYYNNINDNDLFNNSLKGVTTDLSYETIAAIINYLSPATTDNGKLSIDKPQNINHDYVKKYTDAYIKESNGPTGSVYQISLIYRLYSAYLYKNKSVEIANINKLKAYLAKIHWLNEFSSTIRSLFETRGGYPKNYLPILNYLFEPYIHPEIELPKFRFTSSLIVDSKIPSEHFDLNAPITAIILTHLCYYNRISFIHELRHTFHTIANINSKLSDYEKLIYFAKYIAKYLNHNSADALDIYYFICKQALHKT